MEKEEERKIEAGAEERDLSHREEVLMGNAVSKFSVIPDPAVPLGPARRETSNHGVINLLSTTHTISLWIINISGIASSRHLLLSDRDDIYVVRGKS